MRLEKSGKSQGKSHKILENWGNFRQMLFVIFQWQLNEFVYYLLNLIKCSVKKTITEKNTGKWEKILEKSGKNQGILSVRKSGNPEQILMPRFPRMTKVLLHVDLIFVCSVACFTEELLDEKCKYKCLREEMEVCFQELQGMWGACSLKMP